MTSDRLIGYDSSVVIYQDGGVVMEIQVMITKLVPDPLTGEPIIFLEDSRGSDDKFLPIWIGMLEAQAITVVLQGIQLPRPWTHDLLKTAIELNGRVEKVVVTELKENAYYALIYIRKGEEVIPVDARPSDALAVALRVPCPIYVESDVWNKATMNKYSHDDPASSGEAGEEDFDPDPTKIDLATIKPKGTA